MEGGAIAEVAEGQVEERVEVVVSVKRERGGDKKLVEADPAGINQGDLPSDVWLTPFGCLVDRQERKVCESHSS